MKSRNGVFGEVSFRKTAPGSNAARTQYKQAQLMVIGQWALVLAFVLVSLSFWITWVVGVFVGVNLLSVPDERKYLRYLRKNAYPDDPPTAE